MNTSKPWYRRYALGVLVLVLVLVYTSSQVDRQIMGILLEPIKQDLGASDTQMGFLIGLTFALFYATLGMPIAMISDMFTVKERGTAMGIYALGVNIGLLVAYLAGGWMRDHLGWRTTFIVFGLPGLLIALLLRLTVAEPGRGASERTGWPNDITETYHA